MFKNFQNCFLHAGIFLAFYKKIPNIYEFQNPLENNFNIFLSKFRLSTPWSSSIWLLEHNGYLGSADPLVAVVRAPLAPKVTWPLWSGSLRVPSLVFLLIEAERGVLSSHAHSLHSHSLSHILAQVSIVFWLKFDCKKTLSLISLLQDCPHTWRNNFRVRVSIH